MKRSVLRRHARDREEPATDAARAERAAVVRRLGGFAGLPLLSIVGPLLLLPLIARVGGIDGWAAIAIGQAVGGLGGLVGGLGWGLTGPTDVAAASDTTRHRLYLESLGSRLLACAIVTPVCCVVAWVLSTPSGHWTAVLMTVSTTFGALSPTWFSIGISRPSAIAAFETIPRLASTGVAAVLVALSGQIWVYPTVLLVASVVATGLYGGKVAGIRNRDLIHVKAVKVLWRMRSSSATMVVGGAYTSTPVLVVGLVEPVDRLATYGSADRLYRLGLIVISVLTNGLQAWVSERGDTRRGVISRRMRLAFAAHAGLGLAGGLGLALLAPFVSALLFGRPLAADAVICIVLGGTYLLVALNSVIGRLMLIPWGAARQVLIATTAGAAIGVLAMLALGETSGSIGVAIGFALSELVVLVTQTRYVVRFHRAARDVQHA